MTSPKSIPKVVRRDVPKREHSAAPFWVSPMQGAKNMIQVGVILRLGSFNTYYKWLTYCAPMTQKEDSEALELRGGGARVHVLLALRGTF